MTGNEMWNFRALDGGKDELEDNREEGEARANESNDGKFLWIYLVNCSSKWTSQTPTGDLAIEQIELSKGRLWFPRRR